MSIKTRESPQIVKLRKKIKRQIHTQEKKTTSQALAKMSKIIKLHLARESRERVSLQNKDITLFDENQHSAYTQSKYVHHLLSNLKKELKKGRLTKSLGGRVTQKKG